jgi:hypothetical protein
MTNMKNKIKVISILLAGFFVMNSCLKDTADYWKTEVAGKMYATVLVPTLQTMPVKPVPDSVNFSFMINIATDALPTQDITITMKVDSNAVTAYNTRTGKSFLPFPTVGIINPTVVIAKGTRTAIINCVVWGADKLSACSNFIAAISIDQVSGGIPIADNMKSYLLSLPISNPYAADYHGVGYIIHPTAGLISADATVTASTINCKTVVATLAYPGLSPFDYDIEITSNTLVVLGVTCFKVNVIIIDQSTGAPYSLGYGQYTTFTGSATTVPIPLSNDVNYYNPVTKQFVLNVFYNSSAPRNIYEVLTRL